MSWGFLNFAARSGRKSGGRISNFFAARFFATALVALTVFAAGLFDIGTAAAQMSPVSIVAPGNAVVTGFSGAPPPAQIAPGADPGDTTFIDLNGPSLRVFNLQTLGAPPQAQVIPSPPTFTVTAAQIGQVFGVALDNASPPNIYAAATSAYGLPIVVPGPGGTPARVHQGAPGATFMAGLFGPPGQGGLVAKLTGRAPNNGGPGSIWRIDGKTGAVSLFANVTTNGAANSGAALGGLAFDPASNALFVADRQTGIIHSFNVSGAEIDTYDHGTQGLPAAGLPPVPYAPRQVDITSQEFSSDVPATWGYAPPERLIFGLAVHQSRLYYAVAAGLQIWSVGLAPNGAFGTDARLELDVPTGEGPTEISKIVFDDRGDMLLGERGAPTGDYTLLEVAEPGIGSVLRYAPTFNGWQPAPDQYAIGFPQAMTNANGGVALGYGYDANGNIDRAVCNGFVWSTGEDLRNAADATTANALAGLGALDLNGLQGNSADLIVPENAPPLQSYFLDYAPPLDDPAARGHMGDIAIPIVCPHAAAAPALPPIPLAQMLPPGLLPPGLPPGYIPPPMPPSYIPPGSSCTPGTSQVCCPFGTLPGAGGQCQTMCPLGQSDPQSEMLCWMGFSPTSDVNGNAVCLNNIPVVPPISLASAIAGLSPACASQSPLTNPANCPVGATYQSGVCNLGPAPTCSANQPSPLGPGYSYQVTQCCPNGMTPQPNGICPQQACQGPNCTTPNTPPCQGPNCPSQQQSGCSPAPGTICCPPNNVLNKSGTCQPLCPNGLTDPTSELLCSSGVNPTPVNGQYVCLDGTKITGPQPVVNSSGGVKNLISNCTAQSPYANTSFCPLNWAPIPPSPPIPGVTFFCAPTAQQASSPCPGSDIAYPVTSAQSQQLPQCPPGGSTVPNCQGPNCSSQQQSCQGPNCPSQQQPCQGPNCSMPTTPPSGGLCPPNTLEQPAFTCCPHGFVRASSGVCKPLCPGGQTDPASFQKCRLGFDPMPTATGVYRCLNGSMPNPPSNPLGCIMASPLTNPANCPHGATFGPNSQTGGVAVCQETPLMKTCAAQGMQVGLDGQTCANDCPNGGYPYSDIQCCPNGETPGNDGQCQGSTTPTPPPTQTPTSPGCASGQTLFCQPNQNGGCPTGTTYNDSKCTPTAPNTSCGNNVISICCPTNQSPNFTTNPPLCVPNAPGSGSNNQVPVPGNCAAGTDLYCAANTDGSCPPGSQASGYGACVSSIGSCQNNFQWCCPGDELPDPANVGSCCKPGTVPSAKGCLPAGKPQTPTPSQPPSACASGKGPLVCPPQAVCANGGQPAGNGGCCPAGTTPGAGGCVLAIGSTTCPNGGQPLCCTGIAQANFAIGQCCPIGEFASGSACLCAGRFDVNGVCCPDQLDQNGACDSLGSASASKPPGCPPGTVPGRDRDHACIQCPNGYALNANQTMCQRASSGPVPTITALPVQSPQSCRHDEIPTANGCVPFRGIPIPPAPTTVVTPSPTIGVPAKVVPSTQTQTAIPSIPTTQIPCLPNQIRNDRGRCIARPICHDGLVPAPDGGCVRPQANTSSNTPSNAQPTGREKCRDGMVQGPNGCVRQEQKIEKPSTPAPRRFEAAPKLQLPRPPTVSRPLKPLTFTAPPRLNAPAFKFPGRK